MIIGYIYVYTLVAVKIIYLLVYNSGYEYSLLLYMRRN